MKSKSSEVPVRRAWLGFVTELSLFCWRRVVGNCRRLLVPIQLEFEASSRFSRKTMFFFCVVYRALRSGCNSFAATMPSGWIPGPTWQLGYGRRRKNRQRLFRDARMSAVRRGSLHPVRTSSARPGTRRLGNPRRLWEGSTTTSRHAFPPIGRFPGIPFLEI